METLISYKRLSIYPNHNEILGERPVFIRKNIVKGRYQSVEDYLDLHFKLLREDFVACLRDGIQSYRSNKITQNVDIYENIKIFRGKDKYRKNCLKINIPKQDDDSRKFMDGSLLLFTQNSFDKMFMAKVTKRNDEECEAIIEPIYTDDVRLGERFTMVESSTYFDPYFQVLSVLQRMPCTYFPMEKYLIWVDTSSVYIPRYLLNSTQSYRIGGYSFPPWLLPKFQENCLNLNYSQFKAFMAALCQEFVVIQGPPGTGKTFLGVKIVETLIKNSHFWYRNSPILIVSQKNYALDQFLEGLIPITNRLIRVGGQSKSEKLKPFNLIYEQNDIDYISNFYSDTLDDLKMHKRSPRDYLSAMKGALVIGMTTSLAARWRPYLEELRCPIVVVEEAAEVLEAHVVACLTSHCQHLILLGDHQQLQPLTSDHTIGRSYHLGISLFERMIRNGIQCYKLDVQHRMRLEISGLLRAKIYPYLQDHESVRGRPPIAGVCKNVFFFTHRWPEETVNVTSKKNSEEAKFLVAFARHLILNGHKGSDIVILGTYGAQVQELEKYAEKILEAGVKIMTLDAFQGREADIVLLSLVRSEQPGFLTTRNRVCVALSRARNGFYMAGNMDLLANKSKLWFLVKRRLEIQNSIGEELPLHCQVHPKTVSAVKSPSDFAAVRDGGCNRKCEVLLDCGHQCYRLCHTKYKKHKCPKQCDRQNTHESVSEINLSRRLLYSQPGFSTIILRNRHNISTTGDYTSIQVHANENASQINLSTKLPLYGFLITLCKNVVNAVISGVKNLFNRLF